jgi:hypothetical protein
MTLQDFISLSEFLLGVPFQPPLPPLTSLDPDLANVYFNQLSANSPSGLMAQLLNTWTGIQKLPRSQWTAAVNTQIMNDPKMGPLARQVILAWYTGFHPYLGSGPQPDPANYEQTLVWMLAQAHPMAVPLSFGYWQYKPQGS